MVLLAGIGWVWRQKGNERRGLKANGEGFTRFTFPDTRT